MLKGMCALVATSLLALVAGVSAQPAKKSPASAASALRRDPKGVKGTSPFVEALKKGDSALIARDFDAAILAYREAITKEPQNPLGHYRVGEAQVVKGDLKEAEQAFVNGLRFAADTNAGLKAKLEFALADLRERQKAYDGATAQWTDYEAYGTEHKVGFPASATERKKALDTWRRVSSDSVEVKARIDKGLKAADEAVRKSSK